jgi:GDPmannose 4,6-dehydratase
LDWKKYVEVDDRYLRPTEVHVLPGDASRAREKLGWAPDVTFAQLVQIMLDHDFELARQECTLLKERQTREANRVGHA